MVTDGGGSSNPWVSQAFADMLRRSVEAGLAEERAVGGGGLLGEVDMASFGPALMQTGMGLARHPVQLATAWTRYSTDLLRAGLAAEMRLTGMAVDGPVPERRDKRFADPTWRESPWFWWLRQSFELTERLAGELMAEAQVDEQARLKASFAVQSVLDALAPTNLPLVNPAVVKRAYETGGLSLARGLRNFLNDLATNKGQPRQMMPGVFEVGRDLAVTPGKVVFRNDLMELIQYVPQTDEVHEIPLLFSPPWINKYYIMDLAPGRSLVEWAVQHGHTVFTISYRNPDASMRDVRLDDYLLSGPRAALDVITEITGAEKVNLLGLCLGGTLAMALLAYLDATGNDQINSATFLNTLVDFSEPGALGVFTDEATVTRLEKKMARTGFLAGESMRATFDLLRGNDLIWGYVVNNWMLGNDPPAFDLLTWNADSTRMPAGMHAFYLRSCYLENQLAKGEMELAGQLLDLGTVAQDVYVLAAEQDHIAPWRSSYKGALLPKGLARFVLSNSGHIAGIVNPPSPKSRHWVGADGDLPADPDAWRQQAVEHQSTWWEDWATWIGERAGERRPPPRIGSDKHRPQRDAPGEYVLGR
jgi:polyhydroxyalkanoate synthase subunit PhaC